MKELPVDSKIRAMVFDPDPAIRSLLREIFKLRGYEVLTFAHAFVCQMCQCPKDSVFADIIICDISFPGMTGVEFSKHQRPVGCRVKNLALMSGFWWRSDQMRAMNLGCQIIQKPFTLQEIMNWLDVCEATIDPKRILHSCLQEQAHTVVVDDV